jgi:hypothetical protein
MIKKKVITVDESNEKHLEIINYKKWLANIIYGSGRKKKTH